MEAILSRCGYRCDLCLAYKPNIETHPSNQQKLSDGWFKYFGFRIEPDKIVCEGCLAESEQRIDQTCPVRPCVNEKGLENCSLCSQYMCDKLKQRIVTYEEVKGSVSVEIPDDDYYSFIQPYENQRRLDVFRATGETIK